MAKTETLSPATVSRSWLPPLDGGTALMAVLIGFMGFYRALPFDVDRRSTASTPRLSPSRRSMV